MAETTQVNFELRELTIALIRFYGIHEGKWTLGLEFTFGAANVGPSPAEAKPAAFAAVKNAILVRQASDAPDLAFTVDAAVVNPAPEMAPSKRSKS